ncbi:peptidoglycan-binding protein [Scytonema sp. UIC 10036]|uniref:peptidoglycan-binding domain-containing protein n=1 Tax=Scytonema sp. UIC 10036 TaxID=2304196 RepID=UPI0012DAE092|nr:peptidoglycan-binding protein [Scytonema sp. UIC 10036]MUG92285.1 peptidoglycan-binding protein [Scytonema sp. UIC 10036]
MQVATTAIDPILRIGANGPKVKELQELLNCRIPNGDCLTVDSFFGIKTQAAVKIVQYQFLLKQDGIAGPLTWQSLRANTPVNKPVLHRNSYGQQVAIVQEVLFRGGFYQDGAIDGFFREKTEAAVRAFQESQQLISNGIIGHKTWKALSTLATSLTAN